MDKNVDNNLDNNFDDNLVDVDNVDNIDNVGDDSSQLSNLCQIPKTLLSKMDPRHASTSEKFAGKVQTTYNPGPMTEIKFWDEKVDT